jgi:hypothetical protein
MAVFKFLQSVIFAVWGYQVLMEDRDVMDLKVPANYLPHLLGGHPGVTIENSIY